MGRDGAWRINPSAHRRERSGNFFGAGQVRILPGTAMAETTFAEAKQEDVSSIPADVRRKIDC
jgi:hypothetical protein